MTTPEQATAATFPITFDGVEYLLSPLTDADISSLDGWLRHRIIETAAAAAESITNPEIRQLVIDRAIERAMQLTWLSGRGTQMMASPDGLARMMWTMLQKRHPGVSYEKLRAAMFNEANTQAFNRSFAAMQGQPEAESKKEGPQEGA